MESSGIPSPAGPLSVLPGTALSLSGSEGAGEGRGGEGGRVCRADLTSDSAASALPGGSLARPRVLPQPQSPQNTQAPPPPSTGLSLGAQELDRVTSRCSQAPQQAGGGGDLGGPAAQALLCQEMNCRSPAPCPHLRGPSTRLPTVPAA